LTVTIPALFSNELFFEGKTDQDDFLNIIVSPQIPGLPRCGFDGEEEECL